MTIEELRVGNLIGIKLKTYPQNWFKVLEIGQTMKCTDSWKGNVHESGFWDIGEFEGIPLNEEWLIKFQFQPCESSVVSAMSLKLKGGNTINICDDGSFSIDLGKYGAPFDGPLEFIHQLQNLYFALTQQELILK
jgi:hypothetical protein